MKTPTEKMPTTLVRVTAETRRKMSLLIGKRYYERGVRTLGALLDALVCAEAERLDAEDKDGR